MTALGATTRLQGLVNASVLDLIGNTPMVDVSALSPNPRVRILAKLEMQNPFGSVKDRIAKAMIEDAEKRRPAGARARRSSSRRRATPASRSRRSPSIKGYPIKIMMPESVSIERRQMLEVFGAEIILTPGEEGSNGAVRRATAARRRASRLVLPVPVRATTPTRGRTTKARARRSGATSPRSPTSSPGSARAAPSWAPVGT